MCCFHEGSCFTYFLKCLHSVLHVSLSQQISHGGLVGDECVSKFLTFIIRSRYSAQHGKHCDERTRNLTKRPFAYGHLKRRWLTRPPRQIMLVIEHCQLSYIAQGRPVGFSIPCVCLLVQHHSHSLHVALFSASQFFPCPLLFAALV